jgi:hypothetical protein
MDRRALDLIYSEIATSVRKLAEIRDHGETEKAQLDAAKTLVSFGQAAGFVKPDDADQQRVTIVTMGNGAWRMLPGRLNEDEARAAIEAVDTDAHADELRPCPTCGEDRTTDEFPEGFTQCVACQEAYKRKVNERFGLNPDGTEKDDDDADGVGGKVGEQ